MVIYGRNPVREAIRGSRQVQRAWVTKNAARERWLIESGVPWSIATAEEIEHRCGSDAHQGVCAAVSAYRYVAIEQLLSKPTRLIVVLDQVQDPQNLGAICRTAECAGAAGVVIAERRSVEVTPAVCKASAGAVEHLAVARVRNIADFLRAAKAAGRWCYGADAGAELPYDRAEFPAGAVIVLGAEGHGLRPRVAASCDALVSIPQRGRVASLSVGAAAAVLIYAATRQGTSA